MAFSLGNGVFYSVSMLYFTRVIQLPATAVGIGLGIAGGVGIVASYGAGWLSDRIGADRVLLWSQALYGIAIFAYQLTGSPVAFTIVACVVVGSRAANGSSRQTILATWYTGPERVNVRARIRVVMNVCIGLGTIIASGALLVDTGDAYRIAMVVTAVFVLVAVVPVARLGRRAPDLIVALDRRGRRQAPNDAGTEVTGSAQPVRGPSPLRDRVYLASVLCNTVVTMQFGVAGVGVPLWIASTDAPNVMVSVLMVINTVMVALLQVRASRGTNDVMFAGITVRRATWFLAAACLIYALAGHGNVMTAILLLIVAGVAHTLGEVLGEAGGWGMAFELADPCSQGAYQGLSQTGYSVAFALAPIAVTTTAISHGTSGWIILAATFVAAGLGAAAVARLGARTRPARA
jgi:MFS family permease